MERVAGIQTGGSERAFDLYMKARYLRRAAPRPRRHVRHRHADLQHDGRDVHDAAVPRPEGPAEPRHRAFRRLGGHLRRGRRHDGNLPRTARRFRPRSRFAKFVNLPELQQMFRAFADVQTAEMLDLPRPRLEGGKPHVVACPMSEEQRAIQERARRPLRAAPLAEGRSAGGQRPGHHHRRPQARPRRPAALGRRRRTSPARRSTPSSSNVADIWQRTAATRGTQIDLLRHGRATRRRGATRSTTRSSAKLVAARHPPRADRRHRRRRHRRQEAGPLREGPAAARSAC